MTYNLEQGWSSNWQIDHHAANVLACDRLLWLLQNHHGAGANRRWPMPGAKAELENPKPKPSRVQSAPVAPTTQPPARPRYLKLAPFIVRKVADEFGLTVADMKGKRQHDRYAKARFVAVGLMSEMTSMSLLEMGRALGGRDHSTIFNARKHASKMFASEAFRNRVDQIKSELAR